MFFWVISPRAIGRSLNIADQYCSGILFSLLLINAIGARALVKFDCTHEVPQTKSGIVGTEWSDCWWIWENGDFQVYNFNYSMNPEFQHDFVWVKTLEKI